MKNHKVLFTLYAFICTSMLASTTYYVVFSLDIPIRLMIEFQNITLAITALAAFVAIYGLFRAVRGSISSLVIHLIVMYLLLIIPFYYHSLVCEGKWCDMVDWLIRICLGSLAAATLFFYFIGKSLSKINFLPKTFKILIYLAIFILVGGGLYTGIAYFLQFLGVDVGEDYLDAGPMVLLICPPILVYVFYILKVVEADQVDRNIELSQPF